MIEEPPESNVNASVLDILANPEYAPAIARANDEYLYWDKLKYHVPDDINAEAFWNAVKFSRQISSKRLEFAGCTFFYKETDKIREMLYGFDMAFKDAVAIVPDASRFYCLQSSIMEEAIASSQMEGAVTTRKVAKEMLRKQIRPKDNSQQMILNNYNAMRYLSDHKADALTVDFMLDMHRRITEKTLDNPKCEGCFRNDDNVFVVDSITGEIVHVPSPCASIPSAIQQICDFANGEAGGFVHPILKSIVLHFMISYLHPFVDGNGRTARSLFYWFMLKNGYCLTEYLSISRIIYKGKRQYEKAFLHTEHDDLDLGYFINYNLNVIERSFEELKIYLERKSKETDDLPGYRGIGLNERQIRIIRLCMEKPMSVFVCKDFKMLFDVTMKTIRSDLDGLVSFGLMKTVPLNKRLIGYVLAKDFESRLDEIRAKRRQF